MKETRQRTSGFKTKPEQRYIAVAMSRHVSIRGSLDFFGSLLALAALAVAGSNAIAYQPPLTLLPYTFVPSLAYSVAWFLLVLPALWKVLLAAAILFGANSLLYVLWLWFNLGLFIVNPALAPAAIAICIIVFGAINGLLHVGLIKDAERRWVRVHALGYAAATLLFVVPMYDTPRLASRGWIAPFIHVATNAPVLMFVPHAVWSWYKLRAEGYSSPPRARAVIVFVCGYIAFSAYLWRINPSHWTLAWPVRYREIANAAHQDRKGAEGALEATWGTTGGRTLSRGEGVALSFGGVDVDLTTPSGWSARMSDGGRQNRHVRDWFVLRWSGDGNKPIVVRLWVNGRRWETAELRSQPEPKPFGATSIRRAWRFRCEKGTSRTAGLVVCTPAAVSAGDRPIAGPRNELLVDPQRESNFVFNTPYPGHLFGSVSVLAETFLAGCRTSTTCRAVLSFASGGATVEADFPTDQLHRWREIRPEVDALLRDATGRGLDDVPIVSQPEGEFLALPR